MPHPASPAHAVVTHEFEGKAFQFRADGWFNMTKAAQHFGKRVDHFLANAETKAYIAALAQIPGMSGINPIQTQRGRHGGGTWAHPKLAVFFARWLDVKFAVFCDAVIDDLIRKKAELVVTKPDESALVELAKAKEEAAKARAEVAKLKAEQAKLLPDAEQARRFMRGKGHFNFRQAAKLTGFRSEHTLIARLLEDAVIFVGSNGYEPYAHYRQRRLFTMRRFERNGLW